MKKKKKEREDYGQEKAVRGQKFTADGKMGHRSF